MSDIDEEDMAAAGRRMDDSRRSGVAVAARYDARRRRVVVRLDSELELTFPVSAAEGLAGADPGDLSEIEISPSGLGLYWPKLDVDLYVPALLDGVFGSDRWMARRLGAAGGRVRSDRKAAAARENGRKGGRPPKSLTR